MLKRLSKGVLLVKKVIVILSILFLMSSTPALATNQTTCEKAFLSLMWEEIHHAIDEYYDIEGVQAWKMDVLDLKMTNGLSFEAIIQLETFVGAHNTIGTDKLKFIKEVPDGIKLVSFKHTPSKHKDEVLKWYR
jgi:hypothetical protein